VVFFGQHLVSLSNRRKPGQSPTLVALPQWAAFCKGLHEFIGIAASACAVDNEIEAADLWSQAFAHFFPMPDIKTGFVADSL
jgi:hypothetical protein